MAFRSAPTRIEPTAAGSEAVIAEGVLEYHQDTDKLYVSDGVNKNEIAQGGSAGGGRLSNIANPPASAHAYDDEFDSGTLDAKWTPYSIATTNPITSGTIDYTASLTTPIYDAATLPSRMAFQSDSSSVQRFGLVQSVTLDTNATIQIGFDWASQTGAASGEGAFRLRLSNASDSNEHIAIGYHTNSFNSFVYGQKQDNGVDLNRESSQFANFLPFDTSLLNLVIWKKTNDYHFGMSVGGGVWSYLGTVTKTGVTTLNQARIEIFSSNNTPSIITACDYFRYKGSIDYSLINA